MSELEKAKRELEEAYKTEDWDYVVCCQVDYIKALIAEGR